MQIVQYSKKSSLPEEHDLWLTIRYLKYEKVVHLFICLFMWFQMSPVQ